MFHRKDKEDVYAEVVGDLYDNKIISEKTFDKITDWDNEKDKKKMIMNVNHLLKW